MKIVTSGFRYLDIDAYGGIVAKAELLNLQGTDAIAVSTAPLNESIPPSVRAWDAPLTTNYSPDKADTFTIVDISEPEFFDKFIDLDRVDEVIDHHTGFEELWQQRIGDSSTIEFIGAACTQVYEQWADESLLDKMSETSARLLICGILDNTLNFGAQVTTKRDVTAYEKLMQIANLPEDWPKQYFQECEQNILLDMPKSIQNDKKDVPFDTFDGDKKIAFGQLAVWSAPEILATQATTIQETLAGELPDWFMNLISIKDGKSYFVTDRPEIQSWLQNLLSIEFDGSVAKADRLWLRKEIIKHEGPND